MEKHFLKKWALKAWDTENWLYATLDGGIDPPPNLLSCDVTGENTVVISYGHPETCAPYTDVIYHVDDPHEVRTVEIRLTDEGQILMGGTPFPGAEYENHPWTADEAKAFICEYRSAYAEQEGLKTKFYS